MVNVYKIFHLVEYTVNVVGKVSAIIMLASALQHSLENIVITLIHRYNLN